MIPGVPYDAEIEYLESTGTQWIDTGVVGNQMNRVDMLVLRTEANGTRRFVLGTKYISGGSSSVYFDVSASGYWGANSSSGLKCVQNTWYDFSLRRNVGIYNDGLRFYPVSGSTTPFPLRSDKSLLIFGMGSSQTQAYASFHGRISLFKAWNTSNVLVSDMFPVRVGQTGYMYDRVTKRLFGNKGTGSFVLGPDVAKPVIGLWGMRKFTSVKDYVQDGLTNMWDAIDNTGHGHDPEATVWKDLTGNVNLPIEAGGSWESDCLYCDGVNPGVVRRLTVGNGCPYYECVFLLPAVARRTNGRILHIRPYTSVSYEKAVGWGYAAGRENSFVVNRRSNVPLDIHRHSVSCASVERNVVEYATLDGHGLSFEGNYGGGSFGTGIAIGCSLKSNTPIWQSPVECRVFAVRLYSRALSPAEIAHNYAIDKARFNLP